MESIKKIPLISSEIYGLWSCYINETLSKCVFSYFLNRVEDTATRQLLQETLALSTQHIPIITNIFNEDGLPVPNGFTDKDVNINAPRLFTDGFYLAYLSYLARVGMHNYTLILNQITRADIIDYFTQRITESIELYKKAANLRLSKGIFIRAPRIEVPKEVQYLEDKSFMANLFGDKRSLFASEITHIFSHINSNIIGKAMVTGFGQVSKEKQVSDYFFQGKDIATQKINELTSIYTKEGIPVPATSDSYVTDSTVSPFSEKLMMTHSFILTNTSVAYSSMALADNLRSDLMTLFMKYLAQDKKYADEGINIMIENRWLEQFPQAVKHENLAKV